MRLKLSLAFIALSATQAWAADPAVGLWKTEPGETGGFIHVEIAECGDALCGTITEVIGNDNTSIIGKPIIWDMQAKGSGKYNGGRIWAPDQDKTYRSKMRLTGDNLKVEGCVAIICRGQTWTRLN